MAVTRITEGGLGADSFNLPVTLNGTDGSSTDAGDNIVLDASASGVDAGERLLYEGIPPDETMGSLKVTNDVTIDGEIDLEGKLISNARATFGNGGVSGDTRMLTVIGKDQGSANSAFVVYDSALGVKFNVRNDGYVDIRNDVNLATGSITFGTANEGIYLGVTAQTAANLLDDYEEGTWTPAFVSTNATFAYTTQGGNYTKVGRMCLLTFRLEVSGSPGGTTSNTCSISGLPFATATLADSYHGGNIGHYFQFNLSQTGILAFQLSSGAATTELKVVGDNLGETAVLASHLNSTAEIRGQILYHTA